MDTVNRSIKIGNLQVGDEVIVRGIDLNYMILLKVPKQVKVGAHNYIQWSNSKCTRDNSIWYGSNEPKKDVYFDFAHKSIWLVKRIDINK